MTMEPQQYLAVISVVDLYAVTQDYCVACDSMDITTAPMTQFIPAILTFLFHGSPQQTAQEAYAWLSDVGGFERMNFAVDLFTELTIEYVKNIYRELSYLGLNNNDGDNNFFVVKCTAEYVVYICTDALGDHHRSPAVHAPFAIHRTGV